MPLIRDERAGFMKVQSTPSNRELRDLYQKQFYQNDKPGYLEKMWAERSYWYAIWSLRLEQMRSKTKGHGKLLDIGAGGGFFLDCATQIGWQPHGIEPSGFCCQYAQERFSLALFEGFLDDYDGRDGFFDAVHLSLVLEHVADPRKFLKRVMRLLRPGGVLWIETPNDFNPLQEVICDQKSKNQWWIVPEHHLNYFDFDSLSALVKEMGAIEIERYGSFPMELFVLCGFDYIGDPCVGERAHKMRMDFESQVCATSAETMVSLSRAYATAKVGRTCNVMAVRNE